MFAIIWDWFLTNIIGKIKWEFLYKMVGAPYFNLRGPELRKFREMLSANHYIILTRRNTHLSTYLLGLVDLFLRKKMGYWSHCAMNAEDEVTTDDDFRIIEAIGTGVQYSTFMQVFDCDGAALLLPKGFTAEEWSKAVLDAAKQIGKKYDTVFNCLDDSKLSCIELIIHALKASVPNCSVKFKAFETMLKKHKTITPQMLYDCGDFQIAYEAKH